MCDLIQQNARDKPPTLCTDRSKSADAHSLVLLYFWGRAINVYVCISVILHLHPNLSLTLKFSNQKAALLIFCLFFHIMPRVPTSRNLSPPHTHNVYTQVVIVYCTSLCELLYVKLRLDTWTHTYAHAHTQSWSSCSLGSPLVVNSITDESVREREASGWTTVESLQKWCQSDHVHQLEWRFPVRDYKTVKDNTRNKQREGNSEREKFQELSLSILSCVTTTEFWRKVRGANT